MSTMNEECPCTHECPRHGRCDECRTHHLTKKYAVACERIKLKQEKELAKKKNETEKLKSREEKEKAKEEKEKAREERKRTRKEKRAK